METPNKDSLMFYPQLPVLQEGSTADFPNIKAAAKSPLARTLFALDGVKSVFLSNEFITVSKREDLSWCVGGRAIDNSHVFSGTS